MTLLNAELGKEYFIRSIETDDEEMDSFLFSLGCYAGEPITVISRRRGTCVVSIKDGRYTMGDELAECIEI
jgi:ferrous iron transport protein A